MAVEKGNRVKLALAALGGLSMAVVPSSSGTAHTSEHIIASTQSTRAAENEVKIKSGERTIFVSPTPSRESSRNTNLCTPSHLPSVTSDAAISNIFDNLNGPGIVAADAAHEVIVNGKKYIFFSDSLIGSVSHGHINHLEGFIHNSALINIKGKWVSVYGGTYNSPESLIPDPSEDNFKWIDTPISENGKILVFSNTFDNTNPFGHFEGHSGIEVFSINPNGRPVHETTIDLPPDPTTQWGTALTSDPDGEYQYIYGNSNNPSTGNFFGMKIAKVRTGHITDVESWQYWNGTRWMSGESHAALIHTGNVLTGIKYDTNSSQYIGFSIPGSVFTDNQLDISCAESPQGPWTKPEKIAALSVVAEYSNQVAYIPVVFSSTKNADIIVYSTNTTDSDGISEIADDPELYRPEAILVGSNK